MLAIIQENIKKINRQITFTDMVPFCVTLILIICFSFYINKENTGTMMDITYKENNVEKTTIDHSTIFASINGTTYTYSWCQGANKIKEGNKIFFIDDQSAINSGRRLSKLCEK